MRWLFAPRFDQSILMPNVSTVLLILRIIVGVAFLFHGFPKIMAPFSWMGPDAPFPGFLQALSALAEFGGGIAIILGLLTPLVTLGLIINMTVAILAVHLPAGDPFIGGFELPLVFLGIFIMMFTTGPGRYSLDYMIFGKTTERGPVHRQNRVAPAH